MIKVRNIIILLALYILSPLNAQVKTFLNVETGPSWNMLKVSQPGGYFSNANIYGSFVGVTVEQELFTNFTIGTGISFRSFYDGIKMTDDRIGTPGWAGLNGFQIPARAGYRIQFYDFPVSITPSIGYVFGTVQFPSDPYSGNSILSAPDGTAFSYTIDQFRGDEQYHMMETGLSLGFRFPGDWQVGLNMFYNKGFNEVSRSEVGYTDLSSETRIATYYSYGDNMRVTMNLMVPVSNVWQERKMRLRKRIEKAYGGGKGVKEGLEIYFAGDIGALWRIFNYSNPAIAPRPLEHRGIFRYSNLKTGAYAGIMLNSYLGLDAGLYYQRSNTFFSVMYDHEVDALTRNHAPMFLEIPVRLRYFYTLVRGKLDLAVYAGGSVLTHFSSSGYGSGEGTFTYTDPQTGLAADGIFNYTASRTSRIGGALKTGLGVEYMLPIYFPVITMLYADYTHGYAGIDEISVSTSIPEDPSENIISYQGSGWNLSLGVKIPFIIDPKGTNRCGRLPRIR